LTLEEALELRELARKVAWTYGHRVEAWKLHLYATMALDSQEKNLRRRERNKRGRKI
jgi:hypothetical protein